MTVIKNFRADSGNSNFACPISRSEVWYTTSLRTHWQCSKFTTIPQNIPSLIAVSQLKLEPLCCRFLSSSLENFLDEFTMPS